MRFPDHDNREGDNRSAAEVVTTGPFILASASPRRVELLSLLGLTFETQPSGADETFMAGERPEDHVRRLAWAKADAVSRQHPAAWVLGADTIVVIAGEVLGKPESPAEAITMLRKLSDQEHRVFTGFALLHGHQGISVGEVVDSFVRFREITPDEMAWYVQTDEPYDKAGAYAVQGKGAFFIREIRGSYTNVMGLPLAEVVDVLKRVGAITFMT